MAPNYLIYWTGTTDSKSSQDDEELKPKEDSPMIDGERLNSVKDGVQSKCCISGIVYKVFIVQWAFMFASAIFAYFFIGDFVQAIVNKSLVISPISEFYHLWKEPPVSPEMKIYLFNVTNAESWLKGIDRKIKIEQIGPFVYKENWKKNNITFHNHNSSVTYRMRKRFQFLPGESSNEKLKITIPNIPLFSAAATMKTADSWTIMGFKSGLSMMGTQVFDPFVTKSAYEIIWGYDDQLSAMASLMLPPEDIPLPGKFGLMAGKNSSQGDWMTVDTGDRNIRRISETLLFKGKDRFKAWTTESCNQVKGSDGGYYPSWINQGDTLSFFVPELCSNIQLSSNGDEIIYQPAQIKALQFRPSPKMFNYELKENHCFCASSGSSSAQSKKQFEDEEDSIDWPNWLSPSQPETRIEEQEMMSSSCPPKGVLHLGPCQLGAPLSVSWPHFYEADTKLWDAVEGLEQPNEDDHGLIFNIEPIMGLGMSGNIRMQINLQMENSKILPNLPIPKGEDLLLPVMWFDDVINEPPPDLMLMIAGALTAGENAAQKVLIFSGLLLTGQLAIFAGYLLWIRRGRKKTSTP